MQRTKLNQEGNIPVYLMYNGVHYNTIINDIVQLIQLSDHVPEWEPPPAPQRKRGYQSELESTNNDQKCNVNNEKATEPERKRTKQWSPQKRNCKKEECQRQLLQLRCTRRQEYEKKGRKT